MVQRASIFVGIVSLLTLVLFIPGCNGCDDDPEKVWVTFEIKTINSNISYNFGIDWGRGGIGNALGPNDVLTEEYYVNVGEDVHITANGWQYDSNEAGHQIIGRIIVDDEEIYMCADQGTPDEDTEIQCGGPVYIPDNNQ